MSEPIKSVGLVVNPEKPLAIKLAREARVLLAARNLRVFSKGQSLAALAERTQLILVFGGDGTMLRVAREMHGSETPVLGINAGSLGFLTTVPAGDMIMALQAVLDGRFKLHARALLQSVLTRANCKVATHYALNDIVIARGSSARVVRLQVKIEGDLLTDYVCDGMIFATSTGSTAYSMSAGGPILIPGTDAFVMTPICPHSLTNRSVVVGRSTAVHTRILSQPEELLLTVDGQVRLRLRSDDGIEVRRSNRRLHLVVPDGYSYYETLRRKLNWSGANV